MIYTVTFNPAVDYVVHMDKMEMGKTNRTRSEEIYFGGKGINVSCVLAELGIKSKALGFVAGFTGEAIERGLKDAGADTDFVHLESGFSRINVKIKSGEESEINAAGPDIPNEKLDELFIKLDALGDGDTLVLAGSIPASLPPDIYERILARVSGKNIRTVVDATGELLLNVLKYEPFLIKPNDCELAEIFDTETESREQIICLAKRLRGMGARNVLVSMAGDGAVLVDEYGAVYTIGACRGEVKNSVGAGDSMVAGFLAGADKTKDNGEPDYAFALRLGTAAGGATAFSEGLAERAEIEKQLRALEECGVK